MSILETLEPPPLPGCFTAVGPARFVPSMSGADLLGMIFRSCCNLTVSDIQMRAERPVYIHTNKGMEKLDHLGILSPAQMDEILKELITGKTYYSIAMTLNISKDTVRFHIKRIYKKLHVHSQAEAVAIAIKKGYV